MPKHHPDEFDEEIEAISNGLQECMRLERPFLSIERMQEEIDALMDQWLSELTEMDAADPEDDADSPLDDLEVNIMNCVNLRNALDSEDPQTARDARQEWDWHQRLYVSFALARLTFESAVGILRKKAAKKATVRKAFTIALELAEGAGMDLRYWLLQAAQRERLEFTAVAQTRIIRNVRYILRKLRKARG